MKKIIYLTKLIFLTLLINLTSCQKEDIDSNVVLTQLKTLPYTLETLTRSEFESNKALQSKLDCIKSKSRSLLEDERTVYNSEFDFYVETNTASFLQSTDGSFHTYTFAISADEDSEKKYNLIFTSQSDGSYSSKIAQYVFNDQFSFTLKVLDLDLDTTDYIGRTGSLPFIEVCETTIGLECNTWMDNGDCASYIGVSDTSCYYDYNYGYSTPGGGSSVGTPVWIISNPGDNIGGGQGGGSYQNNPNPTGNPDTGSSFVDPNWNKRFSRFVFNLGDQDLQDYVNNINNWESVLPIKNFLVENEYSEEAMDFVIDAIEVIIDGGEVDFEDKIIKDSSFVGTKADCVYELLKSTNNNVFKNVLETFTNGTAKYKLKLFVGGLSNNINEAETSFNEETGLMEVRLSLSAANSSSLEIASTIIHEGIHAELKRIIMNGNNGPNPLPQGRYDYLLSLLQFYEDNYSPNTISNNATHTYMVYYHLQPIAMAVRSLDDNLYSLNHYMWFALEGLEEEAANTNPPIFTDDEIVSFQSLINIPLNDNQNQECDE